MNIIIPLQLNYLLNRLPLRISEVFLQYLIKCLYIFIYISPKPSKATNEVIIFPDYDFTPLLFCKFQCYVLSHCTTIWGITEVSSSIKVFSM